MNKKIADYIKLERSKGIGFDVIKNGLEKAGWPKDEIKIEIESAKKDVEKKDTSKITETTKTEPVKHFDLNWLWIILPLIIITALFIFSSDKSHDATIIQYDWKGLGDNIFDLKQGQEYQICYLSEFIDAINNPDSIEGDIFRKDINPPIALFLNSEIYHINALKTRDISECDKVDDKVLGEICKVTIGKDENICYNNPVVIDFCNNRPDKKLCHGDNWINFCKGYLYEDASYCENTNDIPYCKKLVLSNTAMYRDDSSLCPEEDIIENLMCKAAIEGKSPLPFSDPINCINSYYSMKTN